jgi:tetratricopeptide (TPR) repeat protein
LFGARESFKKALEASGQLRARADSRPEQQQNVISLHNAFGDLLAATDDPNLGDRPAALVHYQTALSIAQKLASADPKNVNARRNLAACYRRLGMMHVDTNPPKGLEYYGNALAVAQDLSAGDPPNVEYRYAASRACMGIGEALLNLRRYDEAVANLTRAVELQKEIAAVSPERVWNLRVLSRTYALLGTALLQRGERERSLEALQQGLAAADRMLERAPASLYHALDRADVLEAMGRYYVTLAGWPGVRPADRRRSEQDARSCYQKSLSMWQGWTRRKVGAPYAARRESRAAAALAAIVTTE